MQTVTKRLQNVSKEVKSGKKEVIANIPTPLSLVRLLLLGNPA